MGVVYSNQSLDIIEYAQDNRDGKLILANYQLRKDQKDMIVKLAKLNGERQATIIRAIIDEWVTTKTRD